MYCLSNRHLKLYDATDTGLHLVSFPCTTSLYDYAVCGLVNFTVVCQKGVNIQSTQ